MKEDLKRLIVDCCIDNLSDEMAAKIVDEWAAGKSVALVMQRMGESDYTNTSWRSGSDLVVHERGAAENVPTNGNRPAITGRSDPSLDARRNAMLTFVDNSGDLLLRGK